jgi:hypothetical protein
VRGVDRPHATRVLAARRVAHEVQPVFDAPVPAASLAAPNNVKSVCAGATKNGRRSRRRPSPMCFADGPRPTRMPFLTRNVSSSEKRPPSSATTSCAVRSASNAAERHDSFAALARATTTAGTAARSSVTRACAIVFARPDPTQAAAAWRTPRSSATRMQSRKRMTPPRVPRAARRVSERLSRGRPGARRAPRATRWRATAPRGRIRNSRAFPRGRGTRATGRREFYVEEGKIPVKTRGCLGADVPRRPVAFRFACRVALVLPGSVLTPFWRFWRRVGQSGPFANKT